jgi:hypothetical protein
MTAVAPTTSPMPTNTLPRAAISSGALMRTRESQSAAVVMAQSPTPSDTPSPTNTATKRATATPTNTPTDEPTPTATRTRATPSPTRTPARVQVTARPTQTPTQVTGGITLIYDPSTLVLINRTDEPVSLRDLNFVQVTSAGRRLEFSSNQWLISSAPSRNLPPQWCVQVWTSEYIELPPPDYCQERAAWRMVGSGRWFWLSTETNSRFEVRRGNVLLAECAISAGECVLNLEDAAS